MAVSTLRFGPFVPDLPIFGTAGSRLIRNALPIRNGYEPARRVAPFTEALPQPALSARFVKTPAGDVFGFVGTANSLRRLSGTGFTNVSKTGGYSTRNGNVWRFTKFGTQLFATNFDNPIQKFDLETDSRFTDAVGASSAGNPNSGNSNPPPNARFMAAVGTFLVLAYTSNEGEVRESAVQWSSNNNPTNFPTPGADEAIQTLSDRQILPTDYGEATGIVAGLTGSQAIVFQERAVQKMNFTRGRAIFEFDLVEGARGCTAPNSVIQVGGDVYYLDDTGVFITDGQRSAGIGASQVDSFLYERIDTNRLAEIRAGFDVRKKVIYWSIPIRDGDSLILVYNFDVGEWGFIDGVKIQCFFRQLSVGLTLEDLDQIAPSLEELPGSLDSDIWKGGGLPIFAGFDENSKMGPLEGATLAATLLTQEVEPIPDRRVFIGFTRPLIDTDQVTVTPYHRERTQDQPARGKPIPLQADGRCVHRLNARYAALQMDVAAGAEWTSTQGLAVVVEPSGVSAAQAATVAANDGFLMLTHDGVPVLDETGRRVVIRPPVVPVVITFLVTSEGDQMVTSDGDEMILSEAA